MSSLLKLEIIAPVRVLNRIEAKAVTVPGVKGYMMILPGHAPMISELGIGLLSAVDAQGKSYEYFISGGYLECDNTHVQVLVEVVEQAQEIDIERAHKAQMRAEERLKEANIDLERAQKALARAKQRISFAEKYSGVKA